MSPDSPEGRKWLALLAGSFADGASAGQVADAMVVLWAAIDAALHPVIGHRGVAALYNRSLNLSAPVHGWLSIAEPGVPAAIDAAALRAALAGQTADEALSGGLALLRTFHDLLASLVGASLTDRLLRQVWAHPSGASPAQDTSS